MLSITSILMVPVIIAVAGGSVVLISKIGGKTASKNIRRMKGFSEDTASSENK
ncbi:MAG: hypothetical protein NC433_04410 [Clostridiales bacterium]|nr:hypothetical protein [Clostridiales bacterium]MCM1296970.1 hypothetical protein [Muribaculaceae bacterium]